MRKLIFALLALCVIARVSVAEDAQALLAPNLDSISVEDLKGDVYFLASDEMRGRDTISTESSIASAYIANRFRKAGLKPAGEDGGWYQNVKFAYTEFTEKPTIKVFEPAGAQPALELVYGQDFSALEGAASSVPSAPLAFAGYAITDKAKNWDDFANVDLKGKVALVFRFEPTSMSNSRGWSRNAFVETKKSLLKKAGAVAAIMVTGPGSTNGTDNWVVSKGPSPEELSPPLTLADSESTGKVDLPFFMASLKAIDRLLGGEGKTKQLQDALDDGERTLDFKGRTVSVEAKAQRVVKTSRNVLGKIEGQSDEWVVLGGHYDHIGLGYFGATDARTGMGQVHNGADDNASGTSAIMEIAEAFAKHGKPRRNFLFIAFTGEEKGLLGSEWYARYPLVPHEKTLAMINIDMIGRVKNQRLEMHGMASSAALSRHVRAVEPLFPALKLKLIEQPVGPVSDMWAFYKAGVPVLFPFSGYNAEMHSAKDDPETINYEGLRDAAQLVAEIAWRVSESDEIPDYKGINKEAKGPDGRYRIPRKDEPAPETPRKPEPKKEAPGKDEEQEEEFSR
ncbi:Bacterial leucyl aminopeptidase [Planctomycetaceae bacterium]|nr:Bacterial leucyl aminopeptidase [Planctomycetaceae bacterium]